ncbi:MAG: enoyl-CoA hydratase/isomerase family protein [Desulfomonile tiedjei]|uniref:Enoyl-CoA hydratase/isomerase family protein n=1 Tax=Desulfomonile tiedjei TaxID=2358 RepID=A0A9D6UZ30_9BACT|nr:enoyl-CoA hydratase/isomerase family protein [Desulfomonile tiedjei]
MSDSIKATVCGDIATVMFDRPKAFNAFDLDAITILMEHLINLAADDTVRGIVISGIGKPFCAGGDLRWVASWPQDPPAAFHNLAARYHQCILEIRRMGKPVIAAINGIAAGGGFSLALACDFRIMARSAIMRQAYTSNGLSIDGGGTFMLPRLVGLAKALEIAAFDEPITAEQALKWGLVTKVADDGHVIEEALKLAEELSRRPLCSFAWSKKLLTDSFGNSLETQLELERAALRACAAHPDGREGISAFLEKRKPAFNR